MLALWLLAVQVAQGWLFFVYLPESIAFLAHYGGTESLTENAILVLSFADEVRVHFYVWIPAWIILVVGLASASFRGRAWSIRMAVAFLALVQLAGVAWAWQTVEEERIRVAGPSV